MALCLCLCRHLALVQVTPVMAPRLPLLPPRLPLFSSASSQGARVLAHCVCLKVGAGDDVGGVRVGDQQQVARKRRKRAKTRLGAGPCRLPPPCGQRWLWSRPLRPPPPRRRRRLSWPATLRSSVTSSISSKSASKKRPMRSRRATPLCLTARSTLSETSAARCLDAACACVSSSAHH